MRADEPRLAVMVEPTLRVTVVPTRIFASEKINVIPGTRSCRSTAACRPGWTARRRWRADARAARRRRRLEIDFMEQVVGNRSPIDSPLMDAIRGWVGEQDRTPRPCPGRAPAFTDSRWFRAAFPDCVAYGFFPSATRRSTTRGR